MKNKDAFQQVDVFTTEPYRGNPVAVVMDGDQLTTKQMHAPMMII
ncbi:PhzF family phenazine biosynthesis protein [Liquorilactobacillus uvarum]|nr:PhzF family phenazine biosynthesis protein [Liquorilactobacillus uvarum]